MPIQVRCDCGHTFRVPDSQAGKRAACPKCAQRVAVPGAGAAGDDEDENPYALADDAAAARVPKIPSADLARPHKCPACGARMKAHEVVCLECGWHAVERRYLAGAPPEEGAAPKSGPPPARSGRRAAPAPPGPYEQYREHTLRVLEAGRKAIEKVAGGKKSELREVLSKVRKDLAGCVPAAELLVAHVISPFSTPEELKAAVVNPVNRDHLVTLARIVPGTAELIAADLDLSRWAIDWREAREQSLRRIQLLLDGIACLGRRAGRNRGILVILDGRDCEPDRIGKESLDDYKTALNRAFRAAGATRCQFDETVGFPDACTRRLELDFTEWKIIDSGGSVGLHIIVQARYTDAEGGKDWRKKVWYIKSGQKVTVNDREWADYLVGKLPDDALDGHEVWPGADVRCPNCGHPQFSTERQAPRCLCWGCGHDAITGYTPDTLVRQRKAAAGYAGGVGMVVVGVILAIAAVVLKLVWKGMPLWAMGVAVVLGFLLLVLGIVTARSAAVETEDVEELQAGQREEFKFPKEANANRAKVEALAKAFPRRTEGEFDEDDD